VHCYFCIRLAILSALRLFDEWVQEWGAVGAAVIRGGGGGGGLLCDPIDGACFNSAQLGVNLEALCGTALAQRFEFPGNAGSCLVSRMSRDTRD